MSRKDKVMTNQETLKKLEEKRDSLKLLHYGIDGRYGGLMVNGKLDKDRDLYFRDAYYNKSGELKEKPVMIWTYIYFKTTDYEEQIEKKTDEIENLARVELNNEVIYENKELALTVHSDKTFTITTDKETINSGEYKFRTYNYYITPGGKVPEGIRNGEYYFDIDYYDDDWKWSTYTADTDW